MRTYAKNRRCTQPRVELLEGKTLLATGSVMHQVAPLVTAAPIVAQATALSGTLAGSYSNVNVPGFSHILSYTTSGTLSGFGSTRLRGTLIVRGGARPGTQGASAPGHFCPQALTIGHFCPMYRAY